MKLISLSQILISPDRHRREFDPSALQDLVEDIRENGLFNAPVLRTDISAEEPLCEYYLCQGERRLRAISDLWDLGGTLRYDGTDIPQGQIPYVTLGDLDPLQAEICELSENMQRENLTWKEESDAVSRIAKLRAKLAENSGAPAPTVAQISEEVRGSSEGIHHETTRRQIILADLIKTDPEIAKATSLDDAWKLAKRKDTAKRNELLGESMGKTFSVSDHFILNEDSLPWLESCESGKFDVILTDPPYGMGADEFAAGGGGTHRYEDSIASFTFLSETLLKHALRITKPQAHLYWFCDIDQFHFTKQRLILAGWEVHRTPLIWHKMGNSGGIPPWPDRGPRRAYELILYATKGKRPVTGIYPDVLSYPSDANLGHQAQKPVALLTDLLRRSCSPGNSVLDPFAGTGSLLPAAHQLKVAATLIEKDISSYGIILNRAKELK